MVKFSILVPIFNFSDSDTVLEHLHNIGRPLTTSCTQKGDRDIPTWQIVVYLAFDPKVGVGSGSGFKDLEARNDIEIIPVEDCSAPAPRSQSVSKMWQICAQRAFEDGCDFLALWHDDVQMLVEGWVETACDAFQEMSSSSGFGFGFGSVSFQDSSLPGLTTVPVIHRTHMEVFKGRLFPHGGFSEAEADDIVEFLFQLYRRFGCSKVIHWGMSNLAGSLDCDAGSRRVGSDGRFISPKEWSFETLDNAVAETWLYLQRKGCNQEILMKKLMTLDVVIPSYRVNLPLLSGILDLESSKTFSVLFMVVIDNPKCPEVNELKRRYADRMDVKILVNERNLGASATRNRGLEESAAEWVHFLDDDVVPEPDILFQVEKAIREHPDVPGFVGNSAFPRAESISTTALHISGVTHFWSVATRIPNDVPWGVGANLVCRRNVRDGIRFQILEPRYAGGEDIDFGLSKRLHALRQPVGRREGFMSAPNVKIIHPWWKGRRWHRFYLWSLGDGYLLQRFPQYTYVDLTPSAAEALLLVSFCGFLASVFGKWMLVVFALKAVASIVLGNIIHDCYRHLYLNPERFKDLDTSLTGLRWFGAVVEGALIRVYREIGWLHWVLQFGGWRYVGLRFDLTAGRLGDGPVREERRNRWQRMGISGLLAVGSILIC